MKIPFLFLFISIFTWNLNAQDSLSVKSDTLEQAYKKRGFLDIFEGKPGRAALYSLVIPGGGQAYNRRWWKVPIALGVEGFFISNIVRKTNSFRSLDTKWRTALEPNGLPIPGCTDFTNAFQIKEERDDARQEMEYSWVYWGISHIIVTFEAFVDRHLMEFDVSEDLSFKVKALEPTHPELGEVTSFGIFYSLN